MILLFQLLKVICLISKRVFFAQESESRSGVKCVGKLASHPLSMGTDIGITCWKQHLAMLKQL